MNNDDRTRIHLTPEERVAAALAAQAAIDRGKRHYGVVDAVINTINANREAR